MKNLKNIAFATILTLSTIGCKKETIPTVKEVATTKTEIAAENLETTNFSIEGMTCEVGCANTIENKLANANGVSEAKVDFESKMTTITFDKTQQNIESLTKIVEKIGGGDLYKVVKFE